MNGVHRTEFGQIDCSPSESACKIRTMQRFFLSLSTCRLCYTPCMSSKSENEQAATLENGSASTGSLHIIRGLSGVVVGTVIGALIPGLLALVYYIYRGSKPEFGPDSGRIYFLDDLLAYWRVPAFGLAIFLGCAAWATLAPPGSYRFLLSLAVIFCVSVLSWFLVAYLDDSLQLYWLKIQKGLDPNYPSLTQALVLFGPPILTAHLLAIIRHWRMIRQRESGRR
jgi:hypothetical protein